MKKSVLGIVVVVLVAGIVFAGVVSFREGGSVEWACDNYSGEVERDSCYSQFALSEGEGELCDEVEDSIRRDGCINVVAIFLKDESLCESSENAFGLCIMGVAAAKGDASLCDKISGEEFPNRRSCVNHVDGVR